MKLGLVGSGGALSLLTHEGTEGLSLWIDAKVPGAYTGTTTKVLADLSAAAHDLSEAEATAPTYSTNAANGLPGFIFNGSQRLRRSEAWLYASGAATIIALVSGCVPVNNDKLISEGRGSGFNTPLYCPIMCGATASTCTSLITSDALGNTLGTSSVLSPNAFLSTPTLITRIDTGNRMISRLNGVEDDYADYTREATTLDLFCLGAESQGSPNSHIELVLHSLIAISGRVPLEAEVAMHEGIMAHNFGVA